MIKFNFNAIRSLRNREGMSQKALAELLQLNPHTISIWENCKDLSTINLTAEIIIALCNHFGVDPSYFFIKENENSETMVSTNRPTSRLIKDLVERIEQAYKIQKEEIEKLQKIHKEEVKELEKSHTQEKNQLKEKIHSFKEEKIHLNYEIEHKDNLIEILEEELKHLRTQINVNTPANSNLFSDNNLCK